MFRGLGLMAAAVLLAAGPARAQDLLGIYGAWVFETAECGRIFATDNGRVVFGAEGRGPLPAFILGPTSMSNNESECRIREYRVRENVVTFDGQCRLGRRTRRQRFTVRELNGRFQVEIDRNFVGLKRCRPEDLKDLATLRSERERFNRENATAQEKALGLWASQPELCSKAFVRDGEGRYAIGQTLGPTDVALIIARNRFVTRASVCTPQQVVNDLQGGQDYQANLLCSAEGREFPTTERIAVIDPDVIERTPAARNPTPQRLFRCSPPDWQAAVRD